MSTELHVLMAAVEYPPRSAGGLGTHVRELAQGLTSRGVAIDVLVPTLHGGTKIESDGKVTVHHVGPSMRTIQLACGMKPDPDGMDPPPKDTDESFVHDISQYAIGLSRGQRVDLIATHDWYYFQAVRRIRDALKVPAVMTLHFLHRLVIDEMFGQTLPDRERIGEETACTQADAVIHVSHDLSRLAAQAYGISENRLFVVHNGMDHRVFQRSSDPDFRQTLASVDERLIVFAGRITRFKGVLDLLAAAAEVIKHHPNVRFLLIGNQLDIVKDSTVLQDAIRSLFEHNPGLESRVSRIPMVSRSELARYYSVSDIAVVPSHYEPFGYAAIEAMAAGLPVIASKVGGLQEIIEPEKSGLLIPVGKDGLGRNVVDVDALARALVRLLDSPDLRARLATGGLARAQAFSVGEMVSKTLAVYEEVVHRHNG